MTQETLTKVYVKQACTNQHCDMKDVPFHNDHIMTHCPFCSKKGIRIVK